MLFKGNIRYQQNEEGIHLPYRLVETCQKHGDIKALVLFVQLKKVHRNGVFYNASARNIAKKTGFSHTTINNHIKNLVKLGLIRIMKGKDGNRQIQLTGYRHYTNVWGKELVFIEHGSKKVVNARLKAQIAIRHIRTQEYNIGRKQGRNRKLDKIVESPENYASLSDRKLALIMGFSNCTANRMKSEWSALGLMIVRPMWGVLLTGISETHYRQAKVNGSIPPYAVYHRCRNRVLVRKADSVSIGAQHNYKYQPYSWTPIGYTGTLK